MMQIQKYAKNYQRKTISVGISLNKAGFPRINLVLPRNKLGVSKMLSVRCLKHFTIIKQNNDNLG